MPLNEFPTMRPVTLGDLSAAICALVTIIGLPLVNAAQSPVLYEIGKPFEIHLASDTNLVLCVENNVCSWKLAGQGTPLRLSFTNGLANARMASIEVVGQANIFLRHFEFRLRTTPMPARRDPFFEADATFEVLPGVMPGSVRLRSFNFRDAFVGRTHSSKACIIPDPHPDTANLVVVYK